MFATSLVSNLRDRPILLRLTKEFLVILTAVNLALQMFPKSAGCSSVKRAHWKHLKRGVSFKKKKNWKVIGQTFRMGPSDFFTAILVSG